MAMTPPSALPQRPPPSPSRWGRDWTAGIAPAQAPPPMAGPMALAPNGPGSAPAPSPAPFPQAITDLSKDLNPAWQLIDYAARQIRKALKTGALYQEPEAKAAIEGWIADGEKIIAAYAKKGATMGPEGDSARVAPVGEDVSYVESPS